MTAEEYNAYDEGEKVTISMSFVNPAGAPTSPTAILLQLRDPSTRTVVEKDEGDMTEDAEGEWHYDVNTLGFEEGVWFYKVYASGDSVGAKEWAFIIKASELA